MFSPTLTKISSAPMLTPMLTPMIRYQTSRIFRNGRFLTFSILFLLFFLLIYKKALDDINSEIHLHSSYIEDFSLYLFLFAELSAILFSFDCAQCDRSFGLAFLWLNPWKNIFSKTLIPLAIFTLTLPGFFSISFFWSYSSAIPLYHFAYPLISSILLFVSTNCIVILISYLNSKKRYSLLSSFILIPFALFAFNFLFVISFLCISILFSLNYMEVSKWLDAY